MIESVLMEDVFDGEDHLALDQCLKTMSYFPLELDEHATMYAGELPTPLARLIEGKVQEAWGEELTPIATFARLNDTELDNTFRIHSDGLVQGQQPTVAAVYYIENGGSGTALMTHEEYGDQGSGIYTTDDGKWTVGEFVAGNANSMFVYEAQAFHTRYPEKSEDTRVVIVSFLKGKE
jgi:hypothetical protein